MPAKKTTKKPVEKKTTVKPAPVMEHKCNCEAGCPCGCHKHGAAHALKHIIILAIVFALGMVVGKALHFGPAKHHMMPKFQPVFVNGCLDTSAIECPKMSEEIMAADVDGDECVSLEEYKSWKQTNKPQKQHKAMRGNKKHK